MTRTEWAIMVVWLIVMLCAAPYVFAQPTPVPNTYEKLLVTGSGYPKFEATNRIMLNGTTGCVITIDMGQGTVVLGENCKPDEASRQFWESLEKAFPYTGRRKP